MENELFKRVSNEQYNLSADKYGISNEAVKWGNQQSQYLRFYDLIKNIDLNDDRKALLDVGCGNCELYKFLNFIGYRGMYTGFDINNKLLEQAAIRFGAIDIHQKDIMSDKVTNKYDYVLMSGLFNLNVGQSIEWVLSFMERMFSLSRELMACNMISTYVNHMDSELFYMDPLEVLKYAITNLSKRVILSHHNLPYNFTITVFRNADWQSI